MPPSPRSVSRILTIHAWGGLGDNIMATPLARETKRNFPDATLTHLILPWWRDLLETNPYIDELIVYDRWRKDRGIMRTAHLIRELRRRRFDLALLPQEAFRAALLPWAAGIPRRVGFATSNSALLYTDRAPNLRGIYQAERLLNLLRYLGGEVVDTAPELFLTDEDRQAARTLLAGLDPARPWVAIAPGAGNPLRRWFPDRLGEVMRRLRAEHGCELVMIGSRGEAELCSRLVAETGGVSCAGATSAREAAAVIERCALLLTMDSGALHLAVAMGRPTVTVLGATTVGFGFVPRGERDLRVEVDLPCRPCRGLARAQRCPLGHFACMDLITADDVLTRVSEALAIPPR